MIAKLKCCDSFFDHLIVIVQGRKLIGGILDVSDLFHVWEIGACEGEENELWRSSSKARAIADFTYFLTTYIRDMNDRTMEQINLRYP